MKRKQQQQLESRLDLSSGGQVCGLQGGKGRLLEEGPEILKWKSPYAALPVSATPSANASQLLHEDTFPGPTPLRVELVAPTTLRVGSHDLFPAVPTFSAEQS